ncbi:hypothetical protein EW026_g7276 [Hermanssonia centrifuga]|uniref:Uncharacterized protein n=1 Tax=Hermanssonia centrifuga TaxID=98765 RepID=A0A4S4KA61_9APHY|nr:hypothetical protein EW026_g7276 [Hermanssonia centrifuga]
MAHGRRHFEHRGHHSHSRLTHQLHLSGQERAEFEALVLANPTAGPLELCVGPRNLKGTGKSAADIALPLLSKDRIKVERNQIRRGSKGDLKSLDASLVEFEEFCVEEDFVIQYPTIGPVSVISMQTAAMQSELIKDAPIEDDAVNGIVTDAAHGFWQESKMLLLISSSYSSVLQMWMPVLISYMNGASADHYHHHFLALFRSIRDRANACGVKLTDSLFRNVLDFSEAERGGFISAYIAFWIEEGSRRSEDDLRSAAEKLLKGCRQHFGAGVTRIGRNSGIIPSEEAALFKKMALGLLDLPSVKKFQKHAKHLLKKFPKIKNWLEWWTP